MRYRLILALILFPLAANAQYLGDAMAAAGFAETADDAAAAGMATLVLSGRIQAPPMQVGGPGMSKNISSPQYSTNVSAQPNSVYYPSGGAQPSPAIAPEPMPQNVPMSAPSVQPYAPSGPGAGFAGSGKVYTPEQVSEWKAGYAPVGLKFDSPPPGAETVGEYKYFKGVFYKPQGGKWVVVPAPVGARVKERPAAGSGILYKNVAYTYYNGAFYVWNREEGAADVVAPPIGATVTYIPDTAVKTERDGKPCYVYGDTCFRPGFRGQTVVYTVG